MALIEQTLQWLSTVEVLQWVATMRFFSADLLFIGLMISMIWIVISTNIHYVLVKKNILNKENKAYRYIQLVLVDIPGVCSMYYLAIFLLMMLLVNDIDMNNFFTQFGGILPPLLLANIILIRCFELFLISKHIIEEGGKLHLSYIIATILIPFTTWLYVIPRIMTI